MNQILALTISFYIVQKIFRRHLSHLTGSILNVKCILYINSISFKIVAIICPLFLLLSYLPTPPVG